MELDLRRRVFDVLRILFICFGSPVWTSVRAGCPAISRNKPMWSLEKLWIQIPGDF